MSTLTLCRHRLTTILITSAIHQVGLNGCAHVEELTFLAQLQTKKPHFAILTNDHLNKPALFTDLRCYSPDTYIIVCILPNAPEPERLWPLLNAVDIDSICTINELTDCLRSLVAGSPFASSLLAIYSVHNTKEWVPGWHDLTPCERRVLQKLVDGQTGPQIADALYVSPKTVNNHKAKIALKLNVRGGPGSLIRFVLLNRERLLALLS